MKGVIKDMTLNDTIDKVIERLMNEYGNDVLRVSFIYLKDRQLAEDAFQEVFLRVYHKYNSFKHESSEKTWIIKITINICKDMLKSNWHKKVLLNEVCNVSIFSGVFNVNVESIISILSIYIILMN